MRLFDLNIDKFLDTWEVRHALREVIANALDEQALTGTADVQITRDATGRWHVRDFGRGLSYEQLTQNENAEKAQHSAIVVGQFGVGLKDALATFERRGVEVRIRSKHGTIGLKRSSKHGFADVPSLHASVEAPDEPEMLGTDVELTGLEDTDIEGGKAYFVRFAGEKVLGRAPDGEVLERGAGPARIYLKGVRIAEESEFLFSYNITNPTKAMQQALNRERSHVGRGAYTDRVKRLLLTCDSEEVARALAEQMSHLERGDAKEEATWIDVQVHACKLLNPTCLFVTAADLRVAGDDIDQARHDGLDVIIISEALSAKLRGQHDRQGAPMRLLDRYQRELSESFVFTFISVEELTAEERRIFTKWPSLVALVGGPKALREVRVSETMRPEVGSRSEVTGLWEPSQGRIVIKRTQLRSMEAFAGTLLHEVAHAETRAPDATREFETGLTGFVGKLAARLVGEGQRHVGTPKA